MHYSPNPGRVYALEEFARQAVSVDPDVVVLAGDIGETLVSTDCFGDCLSLFRENFDCPILVLPGNHDLWVYPKNNHNSRDLWEHTLQSITESLNCFWLEGSNWIHDRIAIVGSYLHYDYSAADKTGAAAGMPDDFWAKNKHKVINDGNYLHGLPDDKTFAKQIGDGFRKRLLEAQNDPQIDSIVIVTHVPCMECQMTRRPQIFDWTLGTPYFGNLSHQEEILACNKVHNVISGHSHQGNDNTVTREGRADLRVVNLSADYGRPAYEIIYVD